MGPHNYRVLLVEDEETTLAIHEAVLSSAGFETVAVRTLAELKVLIGKMKFDIILLDLRLPDGNSLDLVPEIRTRTSAGIIVATSSPDIQDRWRGLESGADEYLTKPVHPRELLARTSNLARRLTAAGTAMADENVHRFEGWSVDLAARRVSVSAGKEFSLTENEFRILEVLIRNVARPVHRDRLAAILNGEENSARAVDKTIYRLRLKFHAVLGRSALFIKTAQGVGYTLISRKV